jgi:amidohydrolase
VVLYRTDMDGLPVKEQTGLPFASQVMIQKGTETVPVMHACGHDILMSSWLTVARIMTELKKQWSGTLVLLAQSAEETGQGAKKAVASAAFSRLPKPDVQLAMHDHAELLAGVAGFCDEYALAAVDMMNITIRGKGGHGAVPQQAIDPVVLASQYVLAIQSVVSRNLSPNDPAVITVGAINGGTAGNIIPDQVVLKLTIRSYSAASRQLILERLKTIGDNLAIAAGLDKDHLPVFDLLDMTIPSVYNDPKLGARLRDVLDRSIGPNMVATVKPVMIGEDFGVYGQQATHIPSYLIWIGTVAPDRKVLAEQGKAELYTLHSSKFAPDYALAVPGAVRVMSVCLLDLMKK